MDVFKRLANHAVTHKLRQMLKNGAYEFDGYFLTYFPNQSHTRRHAATIIRTNDELSSLFSCFRF